MRHPQSIEPNRADRVGLTLDRAIGIAFPGWASRRIAGRITAELRRRTYYAAAKSTQSTGDWRPVDVSINEVISNSTPALRSRTRQLVRDMPHFSRAITILQDYIIGSGLQLQSRVLDPITGKLDKRRNQQIEDAWRWWSDEADFSGRMDLHSMQSLAKRQEVELGEFLLIKRRTTQPGRYLPLAVQMIESDQLTSIGGRPLPGNEIQQGMEYDPRTGRIQAYWFEDAEIGFPKPRRIQADMVTHGFQTLRPNQLRGVTPFAPAILLAHQLRDYLDAEIDGARMAARWLAFIQSPDPAGTMLARGATTDTETTSQRLVEEVGIAIQEYLLPGEQVTIAEHNRPGDAFADFTRFVLRTFAALAGVSYELLSGDYSGINYSTLRGIRNDLMKGIRVHRARFIRQFCIPLQREFMNWAVLGGRIDLPRYFQNPWPYLRSVWLGPGMESIDPLREGRADAQAVESLLRSPQEIILARGRDPEEVLDEFDQWNTEIARRGLSAGKVPQNLQTNPAQVDSQASDGRIIQFLRNSETRSR